MSQTSKPADNGDPKSDGTPDTDVNSGEFTPSRNAPSKAGATGGYESGGETSDSGSESGLSGGGIGRFFEVDKYNPFEDSGKEEKTSGGKSGK
ncbi:hypothetical protein DL95DRAFT_470542 [Leptodontidium sp. 2 PMI_412]|nr:hypothetical protein DL95DRAFT_470542 [Leptodontidium sp. 2 PMI_412]